MTARSTTARTSSSIVMSPPRSGVQAIRQPFTDGARTARTKSPASTSYDSGERSSTPAIADSISAASATVRAIGPSTEYVSHASTDGKRGISPGLVRNPTTPQYEAGPRREPPRSVPSASGHMPVASAAAEPPLEPPAVSARFQGLRVAPNTVFTVFGPNANSGVLVLPITIAPAARSR